MELDFLDILAWMHCPTGAQAGYRPEHPAGEVRLGKEILGAYPRSVYRLQRIAPKGADAGRYLASTAFGAAKAMEPYSAAPPHANAKRGHWINDTGYIELGVSTVEFTLPHLSRRGKHWEITAIDTNAAPPDIRRRSDLVTYLAFLGECFLYLTGEWAGLRLIAPVYELEEIPELPSTNILSLARLLPVLKPASFIRVGPHCRDRKGPPSASEWRCPLREKTCRPFPSGNH